jgi:hypothetical protein
MALLPLLAAAASAPALLHQCPTGKVNMTYHGHTFTQNQGPAAWWRSSKRLQVSDPGSGECWIWRAGPDLRDAAELPRHRRLGLQPVHAARDGTAQHDLQGAARAAHYACQGWRRLGERRQQRPPQPAGRALAPDDGAPGPAGGVGPDHVQFRAVSTQPEIEHDHSSNFRRRPSLAACRSPRSRHDSDSALIFATSTIYPRPRRRFWISTRARWRTSPRSFSAPGPSESCTR